MATQLDLQEQEQLDALKAFWSRQGSLITWSLVLVLGAFAAWNGWHYWQRDQAGKAAAMFEKLDRAASSGDAELAGHIFADLRDHYGSTAFAEQGGLTLAKVEIAKGQLDAARATLDWVAEHAVEDEMRTVARLRLASLEADAHQYEAALKTLDAATAPSFAALVADRRGDALLALGRKDAARASYAAALQGISEQEVYRRVVAAKLMALGGASGGASAAAASGPAK